jgi:hypothetical protein
MVFKSSRGSRRQRSWECDDDVTILLTARDDITVIRNAIQCYKKATGAVLNIRKSRALALGTLDTTLRVLDIPYADEIKVLGFSMKKP